MKKIKQTKGFDINRADDVKDSQRECKKSGTCANAIQATAFNFFLNKFKITETINTSFKYLKTKKLLKTFNENLGVGRYWSIYVLCNLFICRRNEIDFFLSTSINFDDK